MQVQTTTQFSVVKPPQKNELGWIIMNKADLFRQIGWSQELIDHFTIVNDNSDTMAVAIDDIVETFEATTTTIKYNVSGDGTNISISIP